MTIEKTPWWKWKVPKEARGLVFGYLLVFVALSFIALAFDLFVIDPVLERAYGGEALSHQPLSWFSYGTVGPIAEVLVLLTLSMPLWRKHREERRRAVMFLSTALLFYLLWGFVLEALPALETALKGVGTVVICVIPVYHALSAAFTKTMG